MLHFIIFHWKLLLLLFRRLEVRLRGVPVLALRGLHGLHRVHLQPVHPQPGQILEHHAAAEILAQADQEEGAAHDRARVDRGLHVGRAHTRMAPHGIRGHEAAAG